MEKIVAFEHGKKLTFFDLQRRLGRKSDGAICSPRPSADVPVVYIAFDLLWLNGRSLLRAPLRERRELLRGLTMPRTVPIGGGFAGPDRLRKLNRLFRWRAGV
jgi:DNA ligase-1